MRKIIHIDMDCFYAAVEMRDNPALREVPLAVGGSVDKRGVLTTANYVARQYGVRSAMPTSKALALCPNLTIVPCRMDVYRAVSQQIRAIFLRYTSIIEPLSLDEAYLDVSTCELFHGSATLIAQDIRRAIVNELHLTASAGVAPVKFLAKIASDINKPNGMYVITPDKMTDFIRDLPLKKIPGVGDVTAKRLAELGLHNCQDVQHYNLIKLLNEFGKLGRVLFERCNGIDNREIDQDRKRKSVGVEITLANDIYHWPACLNVIEKLYPELEKRLRQVQDNPLIARQGIKFKFDDFRATTQEHIWTQLDKSDFIKLAEQLWQQRREKRGIRLIGLQVTLRDPDKARQLSLL